jgi:sodium transport system ATP-binding protein
LDNLLAIQVSQLSRFLSGYPALNKLSFSVPYGHVFGLLGPNGSGKTTTLRVLAGLLAPGSGQVHVCGYHIPSQLDEIRSSVGFLTYGMKLYGNLTPRENLQFFGALRKIKKEQLETRIQNLISDFEMSTFCNKKFEKLSSGQQQRATIASIILHDPKILLLDEITLSLDIVSSSFIMDFVKEEKRRGKCIIFSTHNMSEAEYLSDKIGFIFKGSILDQGTSSELIQKYGVKNLTEAFLAALSIGERE